MPARRRARPRRRSPPRSVDFEGHGCESRPPRARHARRLPSTHPRAAGPSLSAIVTRPLTLVTGAPGWLGTRLVRVLVNGLPDLPALAQPDPEWRIRCLVLPGISPRVLTDISRAIETVAGDIRDATSLREFFRDARARRSSISAASSIPGGSANSTR